MSTAETIVSGKRGLGAQVVGCHGPDKAGVATRAVVAFTAASGATEVGAVAPEGGNAAPPHNRGFLQATRSGATFSPQPGTARPVSIKVERRSGITTTRRRLVGLKKAAFPLPEPRRDRPRLRVVFRSASGGSIPPGGTSGGTGAANGGIDG